MLYCTLVNISEITDEEISLLKARTEKHFFDPHSFKRKESVFSKALLCYVLNTKFGITDFTVEYGKNGKPFIAGSSVHFNLSHSGDYVLCLCGDERVGCDIQEIKPYNSKIVKRFFTDSELNALENSKAQDLDFTRFWALKESALKFSGEGISGGLDRYDFSEYYEKNDIETDGLMFHVTELPGYVVSICSESGRILQLHADIRDIMNNDF